MKHFLKRMFFLSLVIYTLGFGFSSMADEKTEMIKVKVENVEGGALAVWYNNGEKDCLLPVGETVELPTGAEVYIPRFSNEYPVEYYSKKYDKYAVSNLKKVYLISKSGTTVVYEEFNEEIPETFTIEEDAVIRPEYESSLVIEGEGIENDNESMGEYIHVLPIRKYYDSPTVADIKITAKKDGKEIPLSEVSGVEILSVEYRGNEGYSSEDNGQFYLTDAGIKSEEKLKLGFYRVELAYQRRPDGFETKTFIRIFVGKNALMSFDLAKYLDPETHEWLRIEGTNIYIENTSLYYDASTTTLGQLVSMAGDPRETMPNTVWSYEQTGVWKDELGRIVTENTSRLLKEVSDVNNVFLYPEMKKGTKLYEPIVVKLPSDSKIKVQYFNSWYQKDGKWYFNGEDFQMAKNEWNWKLGNLVYCGQDGALVIDGIAGTSLDDEEGLWLVDKFGVRMTDFSGEKEYGLVRYTIEKGQVVSQEKIEIATPSNAEQLEKLADSLLMSGDQLSGEEFLAAADMLSSGLADMSVENKKKLDDSTIRKIDEILRNVYGVESEIVLEVDDQVVDNLNWEKTDFIGIFAAAGINSEMLGKNLEIAIQLKQLPVATSSNATKQVARFEVDLVVNGKQVQLKSPVLMEIGMSDSFAIEYSPSSYNYYGQHIHNDGKKENFTPVFSEDGGVLHYRAESFSEFVISKKAKTASAVSSGRGGSGRAVSTTLKPTGQWKMDETGWWYRYEDGTYPKSTWVQLVWNDAMYWYYFNDQGYMVTGWMTDGINSFYLHPLADGNRGYLYTGWHEIDGKWYYFYTMEGGPLGAMAKNTTTPDGFRVGIDGVWNQE